MHQTPLTRSLSARADNAVDVHTCNTAESVSLCLALDAKASAIQHWRHAAASLMLCHLRTAFCIAVRRIIGCMSGLKAHLW